MVRQFLVMQFLIAQASDALDALLRRVGLEASMLRSLRVECVETVLATSSATCAKESAVSVLSSASLLGASSDKEGQDKVLRRRFSVQSSTGINSKKVCFSQISYFGAMSGTIGARLCLNHAGCVHKAAMSSLSKVLPSMEICFP